MRAPQRREFLELSYSYTHPHCFPTHLLLRLRPGQDDRLLHMERKLIPKQRRNQQCENNKFLLKLFIPCFFQAGFHSVPRVLSPVYIDHLIHDAAI